MRTLEVGEHELVVVARAEEVVGGGAEADAPHIGGVGPEGLDGAGPPDVVEAAEAVLVPRHQQPPAGVHTHGGNRRALQGGHG